VQWVLLIMIWGPNSLDGTPAISTVADYSSEDMCKLAGKALVAKDMNQRDANMTGKTSLLPRIEFRCFPGPE
jgi:hypothetical protein